MGKKIKTEEMATNKDMTGEPTCVCLLRVRFHLISSKKSSGVGQSLGGGDASWLTRRKVMLRSERGRVLTKLMSKTRPGAVHVKYLIICKCIYMQIYSHCVDIFVGGRVSVYD
jgi:hypothetical protein